MAINAKAAVKLIEKLNSQLITLFLSLLGDKMTLVIYKPSAIIAIDEKNTTSTPASGVTSSDWILKKYKIPLEINVGWALSKISNSCDTIHSNAHLTLPKHHYSQNSDGWAKIDNWFSPIVKDIHFAHPTKSDLNWFSGLLYCCSAHYPTKQS